MKTWRFALAAGLALLLVGPASAQTEIYRATPEDDGLGPVGFRLGFTSWETIEQTHFGAHVKVGEVVENVDFTPNVEIGLGGDLTVVTINGDLTYRFTEMVTAPWGMYGGGSLGLNYVNPDVGDADTDLGLSAVGGFTYEFDNGHEGMLEVRVGLLDSPGFKLTFGYTLF